jgi:hypothetical protein
MDDLRKMFATQGTTKLDYQDLVQRLLLGADQNELCEELVMLGNGERGTFHLFPHRLKRSSGGVRKDPAGPFVQRFYLPTKTSVNPIIAPDLPTAIVEGLRQQLSAHVWQRYKNLRAAMQAMNGDKGGENNGFRNQQIREFNECDCEL